MAELENSKDLISVLWSGADILRSKIVCFHNPDEENGFLSNWYTSHFEIDGRKFSSMEQYMMYKKAMCFHDENIADQIMAITDVATIKKLGRLVSGYDDNIWSGIRQIVVYEGLIQKFIQNQDLRNLLLDTQDGILAECAVRDRIWGIGLSMKDARRYDINEWKGMNLLGYSLMMVRNKLK